MRGGSFFAFFSLIKNWLIYRSPLRRKNGARTSKRRLFPITSFMRYQVSRQET